MRTDSVGQFEVKSGKVIISDPCYERGIGYAGETKAKNGKWAAYIVRLSDAETGGWGDRISKLSVRHIDHPAAIPDTDLPFWVGVDSAQAGIFCDSLYPHGRTGRFGDPGTFYGKACGVTLSDFQAGLVDGLGVVSSSGYGDGGYAAKAKIVDGEAVAIDIIFIDPDAEAEEDDDDYFDDYYYGDE